MANLDVLYRKWKSSGTDESLNELIGSVRSLAFRITYDDDAAQATSIVVLKKLDRFIPLDATAFSRWVNRVIRIERIAARRSHSTYETKEFEEETFDVVCQDEFFDTSILPVFERWVAESLLAGYNLRETAVILDIAPATLRKRLERRRTSQTTTSSL